MTVVAELIAANERYAETFDKGNLPRPPARKIAILTCLDARIMPFQALGLNPGDANVIRNAGGRAADALRSLILATRLLGAQHIIVIHHTDCGSLAFSNEQIRERIGEDLGPDAANLAADMDFLSFNDLEESVRGDVAVIRQSPLIAPDVTVTGFIYDVRTGRLAPVDGADEG